MQSSGDRCFVLPNGECVSPFECPHGPPSPMAVAALMRLGEPVAVPRGLLDLGTASTALIPVTDVEEIASKRGLKQVILVAWDGAREHVVTWGHTLGEADNAADGGNLVKQALHWPPSRYSTSGRVGELLRRVTDLCQLADAAVESGNTVTGSVGADLPGAIAAVRDAMREGWNLENGVKPERMRELVKYANALLDRIVLMGMEPMAGHTYWREVAFLRDFLVAEGFRS